jgi:hypothetical protein
MLQLLTAIRSLLVAGVMIGIKLRKKNSIKSIRNPTFNHNQDPDGKDGSLLGDHGRAEAKDLPTTRRMQNTIQRPTRQTGIWGPFRRQNENEQSHSRDQDKWTRSIPRDGTKPTSSTKQYQGQKSRRHQHTLRRRQY